jgi:cell division protein FtsW (lipid II flippase)
VPLLTYTLLRLALFGAALGLLYLAGLRGWLLPIVAVVVALAVSYLTLRKPRDAATRWMAARSDRRVAQRAVFPKVDVDAVHEDAQVDEELRTERPGR